MAEAIDLLFVCYLGLCFCMLVGSKAPHSSKNRNSNNRMPDNPDRRDRTRMDEKILFVETNQRMNEWLDMLVKTGCFGDDRETAARRLIEQRLYEIQRSYASPGVKK